MEDLLSSTKCSFLRDGVVSALEKQGLEPDEAPYVLNKAGWISGTEHYNGTCDAGLVELDGHRYLVSVMTSAPESDLNRERLTLLCEAVFAARADLA